MSRAVSKSVPWRRRLFTGAFTSKSCCVKSSNEGIAVASGSSREREFFRIVLCRDSIESGGPVDNLALFFSAVSWSSCTKKIKLITNKSCLGWKKKCTSESFDVNCSYYLVNNDEFHQKSGSPIGLCPLIPLFIS